MKISKKYNIYKMISTICIISILFSSCVVMHPHNIYAASSVKVQSKARAYVPFSSYIESIEVTLAAKGDYVTNLKTSSSNLKAVETSRTYGSRGNFSNIALYAKKTGTYKLNFDVYKKNKIKRSHHTVTVYAINCNGFWKVNDKYIAKPNTGFSASNANSPYYYTSAKSVKVSFSVPKGCKLIKLEKVNESKDTAQKISNGSVNSLFRTGYSGEYLTNTLFRATLKDTYSNTVITKQMYVWCPPA